MEESDIQILKKSLRVISNFSDRVDIINSPKEFLNIYVRNLKMLREIGKERKSTFFEKRISEYPILNESEIELFIKKQEKNDSFLSLAGGIIVDFIFNLIKTKGTTFTQIKEKLIKIRDLNNKMTKVVEDPFFEEFYERTI